MAYSATLALLAQLPESDVYINPFKLLAIVATFVCWAFFAQWADKDTLAVNTYRETWNLIIGGLGIGGLLVALFVPNFVIGYPAMVVLTLAGMIAYVLHRNGLVNPEDKVLTAAHFRRMKEEGIFGKKKKKTSEVKERVRITGANKEVLAIPESEEERERYRLTQDLVFDMFWQRASMVDIAPAGEASRIAYEIDGIVKNRDPVPRAEGDAIITLLKQAAGLNLEELRKPQRGRLTAAIGDNKHSVVIETAGSTAGERMRMRVIGIEGSGKVRDLGFTDKQLELIDKCMSREKGLVLLTAPEDAGLTTTVYSFVRSHDAFLQNIQLLEYLKEFDVDNVTQRLHEPAEDKTFFSDMQRMVRSDPDIIVFPELRDRESALLASQSGEKIRVYVGMQANDVFDALKRWTQLVGDKGSVAKSLWMITNQRLIRRLCGECKQPYKPEAAMLKKLNMPSDAVLHRQPEPQYDKHGNPIICQACQGTGYVGRVAVLDILYIDDELRNVIRTASSVAEVQAFAVKRGGIGLQTQALQKVLDGTTSIQEVVRVIRGGQGGGTAAKRPAPAPKPTASKPKT